jgi:cellulase/cellobiase CelA1
VLFTLRSVCQGSSTVYTNVASGTATNSGWVQLTGSFEVPSCTLSQLGIYAEGPRTTVVLYVDDVSIVRTSLVCPGETAPLQGQFIVQTDWGTGYCVELRVTNTTALPTTNWSAALNLNGATIFDIWNLESTSLTGTPTLTPEPWAGELDPGEATHSLGFCANRPSGSSALPSGLAVTGEF